jgi:hypothetical protein
VDQYIRASAEFDASHTDGARLRCARRHGHHWRVEVEKRVTTDPADLEHDLWALVSEWQDRDLDEMLHVTAQLSVTRLASWVAERLLLRHPTLVSALVSDGHVAGIARFDPK